MTKLSYAEQLRHPFWQRKRLQTLERDGWACAACLSTETTLHVHHKRYIKGRMVWEYELEDLVTYCENCHADEHAAKDLLHEILSKSDAFNSYRVATALVAGYLEQRYAIDAELASRARELGFREFEVGAFAALAGLSSFAHSASFIESIRDSDNLAIGPAGENALERWKAIHRTVFKE